MAQQPRRSDVTDEEIQKYLDNGGKITVCEPGARTEDIEIKGGFYGRKPKKKEDE